MLWDPVKNTFKNIPTPKDLFCAGHTQLPDGKLLVAGGTKRYEKLKGDVDQGRRPDDRPQREPGQADDPARGHPVHRQGERQDLRVQGPASWSRAPRRSSTRRPGRSCATTRASAAIYVEAQKRGTKYETGTEDNYRVAGLTGSDARNIYGIAQKLAFDKKDFQGIKDAYEFDPVAEKYITVDPMNEARWYPTLTTLEDGKVLAVSGLDEIGQVVPGKNEIYDPKTKKWKYLPGMPVSSRPTPRSS